MGLKHILFTKVLQGFKLIRTGAKGRGSVVGIASGYGLDSPGIEFRWGQDGSHTSRSALEPTQPAMQ